MLKIEIDTARITALKREYLNGLALDIEHAKNIYAAQIYISERIKKFQNRQQKALYESGQPVLENGRQDVLLDRVLSSGAPEAWPAHRVVFSLLYGLQLPTEPALPEQPCCQHGADFRSLDADTYVTQLNFGPPEERWLGGYTSICAYIAPCKLLKVLWIGPEKYYLAALNSLGAETDNWTDWAGIHDNYNNLLKTKCHDSVRN